MATKNHGAAIKDDRQYEALRDQGMSKQKSARIANSPKTLAGKRGGQSDRYEEWTRAELYDKAKAVDLEGRSAMSKKDLIRALRSH